MHSEDPVWSVTDHPRACLTQSTIWFMHIVQNGRFKKIKISLGSAALYTTYPSHEESRKSNSEREAKERSSAPDSFLPTASACFRPRTMMFLPFKPPPPEPATSELGPMSCFRLAVIHHRRSWWILNQPSIIKSSTRASSSPRGGDVAAEELWFISPESPVLTWCASVATGPLGGFQSKNQASPLRRGVQPGRDLICRNREIPSADVLRWRWRREAVSATSGFIVAGLWGDIRTHTGSHFPVLWTADITRWGGGGEDILRLVKAVLSSWDDLLAGGAAALTTSEHF